MNRSEQNCLILNHLTTRKNISEMPGLILIFECDIGIFIIFSPLQAQGYNTDSHSTCSSSPLAAGLGAPCRAQHCTDSINSLCLESMLILSHCLVYYMVCIVSIFGS